MQVASIKKSTERVAKYADMLSAMGTEPRLRIMQLLLSAHPDGLVVSDIQSELDIPNSTLSHHLDKLKNEELVKVRRESTFLRYTANTEALQELLQFLYAECCTRNKAVKLQDIVQLCKYRRRHHEHHRHQESSQRKVWAGSLAREDWRK
jgi:ArsR family transcriptional regulator